MSVRRLLNKVLIKYDYRIVKCRSLQNILAQKFKLTDDFSFVQIGANDGVQFDDLYDFVTSRKSKGLVVEPIKFYFDKLKQNYKKYPEIIPINLAIHATEQKAFIHYVDPDSLSMAPKWAEGIGSLDPEHYKKGMGKTPSECIISEEVSCITLMDLVRKHDLLKIDLLQIDAEGYDFEILKTIDFNIIKPAHIKYEHAHLKKDEQLSALTVLYTQGYEVFEQGNDSIAVLCT